MFNLGTIIIYILCSLIIYSIGRTIYFKKNQIPKSDIYILREIILVCLVAYGSALIVLLFLQNTAGFTGFIDKGFLNPIERITTGLGINFVPFKSINDFLSTLNNPYIDNSAIVYRNILGNIVLFTPISFAMTLLWSRWQNPKNMILFALLAPIGVEFIQLFIGRSVDIDDVILNFTGLMIGYLLAKLGIKLFQRTYEKHIFA